MSNLELPYKGDIDRHPWVQISAPENLLFDPKEEMPNQIYIYFNHPGVMNQKLPI